jgi:DNA repair photolyase
MKAGANQIMIKITEIRAKSILNKSKIFDYCLNCYTGCQVNCRYCYAGLFMRRYSGHSEPWGQFVDIKVNAADLLRTQIVKAKRGIVWISSVCDAYQPVESEYKLTRQCLEILVERQFPVQVQSKSALLLRDLDLFKTFKDIEVGFTITTEDERIAGLFEPGASSVAERISALGRLSAEGIKTFVFIGPILPGNPENLVASLEGKAGRVLIDRMNYIDTVKGFYSRQALDYAVTDGFFKSQTRRLTEELKKRKMNFEVVYRP